MSLAMWHRVMTRPCWCDNDDIYAVYQRLREPIASASIRLVANGVYDYLVADKKQFCKPDDFGTCIPIGDTCWMEWRYDNCQIGVLIQSASRKTGADALIVDAPGFADAACAKLAQMHIFANSEGDVRYYGGAEQRYDSSGAPLTLELSAWGSTDARGSIVIGEVVKTVNAAFAFAHCKNVKQHDITAKHGPEEKWCRRQKVPSIVYETLLIPGFVYEGRVVDRDGNLGEIATEERRGHLVRGHFAVYTAESPRFGRPGDFGKFWIPQHTRGNPTYGVVVKDYKVRPSDQFNPKLICPPTRVAVCEPPECL